MNIQALRGTEDILPSSAFLWSMVEQKSRSLFAIFGYEEVRTPIIEEAALFIRAVGETTDVVQKEMYVFTDKGNRQICLRPEGTAGVVRAYLEHGLGQMEGLVKLFYIGPMFRSERPQAGRQRQFHQIGVEALGSASPWVEVELVGLLAQLLSEVGIRDTRVYLNNLGCFKDRSRLTENLRRELTSVREEFCEDCKARFDRNILRILDCKKPHCHELVKENVRTSIQKEVCPDCAAHFQKVLAGLKETGVTYELQPHLVRGLDYYTGTVFEVCSPSLGAQDTLAAGGRYDHLVKDLGERDVPAAGWALGMERLLMILRKERQGSGDLETPPDPVVYVVVASEDLRSEGFKLLTSLRQAKICAAMDLGEDRSLKGQLRTANKKGARLVLLLGQEEWRREEVILKDMKEGKQELVPKGKVLDLIRNQISK